MVTDWSAPVTLKGLGMEQQCVACDVPLTSSYMPINIT